MDKLVKETAGPSRDIPSKTQKGRSSQSKSLTSPVNPSAGASSLPEKLDNRKNSEKSSKADEIIFKDPFAETRKIVADREAPSDKLPPSKSRIASDAEPITKYAQPEGEESPQETLHVLQKTTPVIDSRPALLIGLSGVRSSGKTTISHLLRLCLPSSSPVFVLHQDDFLIPKRLLVPSSTGDLNADCQDAIDFTAFINMLEYAKHEGTLPSTFHAEKAEEEKLAIANSKLHPKTLDQLKALVLQSEHFEIGRPIGLVDGILLYQNPTIRELLDVKLLLRASKEKSRMRHFEKPENKATDGGGKFFWKTQDYFDRMVWQTYSQEHGPLFEEGDVQGKPIENVCAGLQIFVQPEIDQNVDDTLQWVVKSIINSLNNLKFQETLRMERNQMAAQKYDLCNCHSGWLEKVWRMLNDLL